MGGAEPPARESETTFFDRQKANAHTHYRGYNEVVVLGAHPFRLICE